MEEVQALIAEAPGIAALSPELSISENGGVDGLKTDAELLSILARRYSWEVVPSLKILPGQEPNLTSILSDERTEHWSGFHFNLTALEPPIRQEWLDRLNRIPVPVAIRNRLFISAGDSSYVALRSSD
jgi:hypothetical protein